MNTKSDLVEFVRLVRIMRSRQKTYFHDRNKSTLVAAKKAEKDVDDWLKAHSQAAPVEPAGNQPALL